MKFIESHSTCLNTIKHIWESLRLFEFHWNTLEATESISNYMCFCCCGDHWKSVNRKHKLESHRASLKHASPWQFVRFLTKILEITHNPAKSLNIILFCYRSWNLSQTSWKSLNMFEKSKNINLGKSTIVWKSMKICKDLQIILSISEHLLKSLNIFENRWKTIKIIDNLWKSLKSVDITGNFGNHRKRIDRISLSTWCPKMPWGPHLVKPAHH